MYFDKFPNIYYQFDIGGQKTLKVVKDITLNVRLRKAILENVTLYDEYDVKDGETPEIIAAKYYGDSQYHWVIMIANQRYDLIEDFPRSTRALEEYIFSKYEEPYGVHHWVNSEGHIVPAGTLGSTSVSNYQYESDKNESKRRIKLITPSLLQQILDQFKSII